MQNCPGISWGPDKHINLFRTSIGWLAVYYDDEYATPEIIRVFHPKHIVEYDAMVRIVSWYNYNTERLCPTVKILNDMTA